MKKLYYVLIFACSQLIFASGKIIINNKSHQEVFISIITSVSNEFYMPPNKELNFYFDNEKIDAITIHGQTLYDIGYRSCELTINADSKLLINWPDEKLEL